MAPSSVSASLPSWVVRFRYMDSLGIDYLGGRLEHHPEALSATASPLMRG